MLNFLNDGPTYKVHRQSLEKIIENPLRENVFLVMDSAEFKGIKFAKIHGLPDIFDSIENLT